MSDGKEKSKTVQQIVDEYLNRQRTPEFKEIVVETEHCGSNTYHEVTNLKEGGSWGLQEYDCIIDNEYVHIKIFGKIIRYVKKIKE